ncbi:carbohydrate sulfotransferase 11-like [Agrilus planipennis]|uniref:Carbohydrate sulfotransferase n=1 Tax=Agrilus planipennis TaxID=224129 RepID=A0A1W4WV59_AGRPL|nr:carbohydrate sulfotransferase 11-like [Agrilus planipennis]XP_018324387.1 carbohydrate sulfotransferase 11-like [Agrilus planipennis]XP_018324388.1 carbohydrate sulfotransferase 11-like [Agrilus planipennis]
MDKWRLFLKKMSLMACYTNRMVQIMCITVFIMFVFQFYKYLQASSPSRQIENCNCNLSDNSLDTVALRNKARIQRLCNTCKNWEKQIEINFKPKASEYLINNRYKLVYCKIFKAASSSWLYNFNLMAGYNTSYINEFITDPMGLIRKKYFRPSFFELKRANRVYTSFIIVRHPFERLLSAFKDKLECARDNNKAYRRLRLLIKKGRRGQNPGAYLRNCTSGPTFFQFITYVIRMAKINRFNEHWEPVWSFCTPCFFEFDVIAHVETLQEDADYLIKHAKLEDVIKPQWRHKSASQTKDEAKKYFSELSQSQIKDLYNIYRQDFEMFGYSVDEYLYHQR